MSAVSGLTSALTQPSSSSPPPNETSPAEAENTSQSSDTTQSNQTSETAKPVEPAPEPEETAASNPSTQNTSTAPSAESQVAAKSEAPDPTSDTDARPERIELDDAQTLAAARQVAEDYRVVAARNEFLRGLVDLNNEDRTGENMDLRVPLIDELPDRPMPEIKPSAS